MVLALADAAVGPVAARPAIAAAAAVRLEAVASARMLEWRAGDGWH
ncbi:hypothetical protein [Mangrovactinospora gilvigrisea]|nr:hypothetical protein [Mangrovactinospora gilvigrisea]